MVQDKSEDGRPVVALKAYIAESRDRESNTFYIASICDDEKDEVINELIDYDRDELEKEVLQQYPDIPIENG